MELLRERVDALWSKEGNIYMKCLGMLLIAMLILILFMCYKWVNLLFCVLVLSILVVHTELCLKTNSYFAKKRGGLEHVKSGDLVFFRSFHSYDIPEVMLYRYAHAWISKVYFGHVGMIVKDSNSNGGRTYILHCPEDGSFDEYSRTHKNGPSLHDAKDFINAYEGRVNIVPTNIHAYIEGDDQILSVLGDVNHYRFLENGMGCCNFIKHVLVNLNVMKAQTLMTCDSFLEPSRYKIPIVFEEPILVENQFVQTK